MTLSRSEPLLTTTSAQANFFVPASAVYIYGVSTEERAAINPEWQAEAAERGVRFIELREAGRSAVQIKAEQRDVQSGLRAEHALYEALGVDGAAQIYLDITGLAHHVWAAVLISLIRANQSERLTCVYVEPGEYTPSSDPIRGALFDLSERIEGIAALPGLAFLRDRTQFEGECVVPLLGFEGTRLAHVLERTQSSGGEVYPVVGVPGFRLDYPFVTLDGNFEELDSRKLWRSVEFATANCPFSGFFAIREIAARLPRHLLRVAPIGTKPHGLGAVLFALSRPSHTEIVYDHPIRKVGRTSGAARVCVYEVGTFIDSDVFRWSGDYELASR